MQITFSNVSKRYTNEWILKDININFEEGSRYGISGANGVGKSTLMKLISGFLSPTKGLITYEVNGKSIDADSIYQHVSYAAPYVDPVPDFSLQELLTFHETFKSFCLSKEKITDLLGFSKKHRRKTLKYYSSGMQQRVKLALALCSVSSLVILDEPTITLDQSGILFYKNLLSQTQQESRTVLISSNVESDFIDCPSVLHIKNKQLL